MTNSDTDLAAAARAAGYQLVDLDLSRFHLAERHRCVVKDCLMIIPPGRVVCHEHGHRSSGYLKVETLEGWGLSPKKPGQKSV